MRRWIRTAARKLGYDFRKIQEFDGPTLVDFLEAHQIDLVLDVGANIGQFAAALRQKGYRDEIVSFEPISDVFESLKTRAGADSKWQVRKLALGAHTGRATINVSEKTVFSSLLPEAMAAQRFDAGAVVTRAEEIDIVKLDDIFEPFRCRNTFLKVDTQGYERQVLDGAAMSLPLLKGVQLEIPIVPLYQNTWSFDEAITFMAKVGFVVSQITPTNYHWEDRASLLEVDCVFRRQHNEKQ